MPETSRIIEEMHESMRAFDELGLMEPQEAAATEALYDACKVPQYSPENVRNLRSRFSLTQMVKERTGLGDAELRTHSYKELDLSKNLSP